MSGLSTVINAGAGAINGYQQQQYTQNAQDALQEQRTNQALKDAAAQQTYQPQAQAAIAGAGLSQAQSTAQASLVPAQTGVAATNLDTQQQAATSANARQPVVNQIADNQATTQSDLTGAQAANAPQQAGDMKLQQAQADQQSHVTALTGLYSSMREGPQAAAQYVQKVADSGQYPGLQGKQIGQVGLTPDGQNFVAQDTEGNQVFTLPVSALQQAYKMSIPTEFHDVKPGSSLIGTQGGNITSTTQAAVPDGWKNMHAPAVVQTADWITKNMPGVNPAKAIEMAKAASTMSRANWVATMAGKYAMPGQEKNAGALAQQMGQLYDNIQKGSSPGLSNVGGSNSGSPSIIDSLIGGGNNPTQTIDNPYAPDQ